MKRLLFTILLFLFPYINNAQTVVFNYTGVSEYWIVPNRVDSIFVEIWGAAGGGDTLAGYGAKLSGYLPVTPGQKLMFTVGGKAIQHTGGFNGGGSGHIKDSINWSGGGGGASDIRVVPYTLDDRIIVAGGGGGRGAGVYTIPIGGHASCPVGLDGGGSFGSGGFGAEIDTGGTGGPGWLGSVSGYNGSFGLGGNGGNLSGCYVEQPGGGGGAGYYGGGGGGADCFPIDTGAAAAVGGAGGGGSSLYPGGWNCHSGGNAGDGLIKISYGAVSLDNNEAQINLIFDRSTGNLKIIESGTLFLSVYNINGKLILEQQGLDQLKVNFQDFDKGLYLLKLRTESGTIMQKLVY